MPLEVELHAVPHLKDLIISQNIFGWQDRGSTFKYQKIHFKIPILLHKEPRPYFNIAGSVRQYYIISFLPPSHHSSTSSIYR